MFQQKSYSWTIRWYENASNFVFMFANNTSYDNLWGIYTEEASSYLCAKFES